MPTRKDFILTDPQVVSLPSIFARNADLQVRCALCEAVVTVGLHSYWQRRRRGPWLCRSCLGPLLAQRAAERHRDPVYSKRVHNAAVRAKIAASSKLAWLDQTKRSNHLRHRQTAESRSTISALVRARWAAARESSRQLRQDTFIGKASELHDGKYDYSAVAYQTAHEPVTIYCNTCGSHFEQLPMVHLRGSGCPSCNVSPGQREIYNFLSNRFECSLNDRTALAPLEIDIYLPAFKLGIEYHGLFWHSYDRPETKAERERHQRKYRYASDRGVTLMQFCDHEWRERGTIVKSIIEHKLKLSRPYHARSLDVITMTDAQARSFFTANHLAGHRTASNYIGLATDSEIVMAIAASRISKSNDIEIIRMASKVGCGIRGGASRLLKHLIAILRPTNVYTFADLRYATGAGYKQLGFIEQHITKPGYFYHLNGRIIRSRQQCQKHKLARWLTTYRHDLSEAQNMFAAGYRRFWDAGHMKLVLPC